MRGNTRNIQYVGTSESDGAIGGLLPRLRLRTKLPQCRPPSPLLPGLRIPRCHAEKLDPRILAMADPLSTIANVLAILKLAAAATQYIKEVKQASSDRLRLRDELRSTTCLLEMLRDRLEDSEYADDSDAETLKPRSITSLQGTDGPLELFRHVLEEIIKKLAPQNRLGRLAQSFTWPFDKKDVAELVSTLERLKSHFTLVMQNDLV